MEYQLEQRNTKVFIMEPVFEKHPPTRDKSWRESQKGTKTKGPRPGVGLQREKKTLRPSPEQVKSHCDSTGGSDRKKRSERSDQEEEQ
jgi:hypothetical protein